MSKQYHVHFEACRVPRRDKFLKFYTMSSFLEHYSYLIHNSVDLDYIVSNFKAYVRFELLESNITSHRVFIDLVDLPTKFQLSFDAYAVLLTNIAKELKEEGIEIEWVPCILRQLSVDKAWDVVRFIEDNKLFFLGLAGGPESLHPIRKFNSIWSYVSKNWGRYCKLILHAGEEKGTADQVLEAIELGVSHIGHGVQIFDGKHQYIIEAIKRANVTLDLCPISNECLGFVNSFPSDLILESGIKYTINSDDPYIFNCTVKDNLDIFIDRARGNWE